MAVSYHRRCSASYSPSRLQFHWINNLFIIYITTLLVINHSTSSATAQVSWFLFYIPTPLPTTHSAAQCISYVWYSVLCSNTFVNHIHAEKSVRFHEMNRLKYAQHIVINRCACDIYPHYLRFAHNQSLTFRHDATHSHFIILIVFTLWHLVCSFVYIFSVI